MQGATKVFGVAFINLQKAQNRNDQRSNSTKKLFFAVLAAPCIINGKILSCTMADQTNVNGAFLSPPNISMACAINFL